MTEREIRLWMLEESAQDSWWISVDGETGEDAVSLAKAADYASAHEDSQVQLLHSEQGEVKNPPWIILEPHPVMTAEERENLSRPKSWVGLCIQLAILAGVIGGIIYAFMPEPVRDPLEQKLRANIGKQEMLQRLSRVEELGEESEPGIDALLARSGRIFFITNRNKTTWPSLKVSLGDGYLCDWKEPVPPGATMQIPFRMFVGEDGATLEDGKDVDLYRIVLEVPGLQKWEKIL
ncbi:hypothetical protein [Ruficoccus sp. ZRK36]|uniref:hypothetical protein n=1 Tax=Ruficoccus sp. ZRK36 TaxID=2866311 RepID=UPI001C72D943|nr:hypothetical protein [Ruficoccus sp. ZRK36]QYY37145.1 hypothetical protein K0V07_06595 [Ruficoccus sp. ZRK36]